MLGPHARTDRTRDTRVAEPWLPAPEDGWPGEGHRLTPDAPHNGGRPPPPGTAPHKPHATQPPWGHAGQGHSFGPPHPYTRAHSTWVADPNSPPSGRAVGRGTAPDLRGPSQWWKAPPPGTPFRHPHSEQRRPARAHAVGPVLSPHTRTDRTRNTRVVEPWLPAPEDGGPGEGQRLTPDAPHNGGRPPPPGTAPPPSPRHAAHTGHASQGDSVGPPHPHTRAHSTWVADPNSPLSGRAVRGGTAPDVRRPSQWWKAHSPGTPFPPPPQRATPACKGAHCGADAGSPRPHRPHPGYAGRRALAASSRGRAAGGGTAPDSRRPSQRWQATLPGDGPPPPPRHAAPTGHAGQGDSVGPPHPHTRAHSTWVADPTSPPSGRAVGGGTAPDTRRPSQRWQANPPGDGLPPPPRHAAPIGHAGQGDSVGPPHPHTRAHSTWVADPNSPPSGRAVGGGTAPDLTRPSQWWKAPPPGTPFRHPQSEQRRPARAHAVEPVLSPHARTYRTRDTRVAEPWLPASENGRPGEGQRLTPDAPHNGGRPPPPGTSPH